MTPIQDFKVTPLFDAEYLTAELLVERWERKHGRAKEFWSGEIN